MHRVTSRPPRPSHFLPSIAAAVAAGLLVAACGGGGGGGEGTPAAAPGPAPAPAPAPAVSRADASADAANGADSGTAAADTVGSIVDSTQALIASVAVASPSVAVQSVGSGRASPQDGTTVVRDVDITCASGGTATITITGTSVATAHNGVFDAGESYSVVYTHCKGGLGLATLDGTVTLTVDSVSADAAPVTALTVTASPLTVTVPQGSAVFNGTAHLSRSSTTAGGTTTTTSTITADSLSLATNYNARSGSFTVAGLSGTRVVTSDASGTATGSTYEGHHTLSGTANGRSISTTVATTAALTFDGSGNLTGGAWTVTRSDARIAAALAAGVVTLTLDQGNDGSIDDTWTLTPAALEAAGG